MSRYRHGALARLLHQCSQLLLHGPSPSGYLLLQACDHASASRPGTQHVCSLVRQLHNGIMHKSPVGQALPKVNNTRRASSTAKLAPKKRGRPKKSVTESAVAEAKLILGLPQQVAGAAGTSGMAEAGQRKPGRPRGSKNKPKESKELHPSREHGNIPRTGEQSMLEKVSARWNKQTDQIAQGPAASGPCQEGLGPSGRNGVGPMQESVPSASAREATASANTDQLVPVVKARRRRKLEGASTSHTTAAALDFDDIVQTFKWRLAEQRAAGEDIAAILVPAALRNGVDGAAEAADGNALDLQQGDQWSMMPSKLPVAFTPPPLPGTPSKLPRSQRNLLKRALLDFQESPYVQDEARALYVTSKLFKTAVVQFRQFTTIGATPQLITALEALLPDTAFKKYYKKADVVTYNPEELDFDATRLLLFPLFARFVVMHYGAQLASYNLANDLGHQPHALRQPLTGDLVMSADLRQPHLWHKTARAMTRRFVYHKGPTNSGKTYNALQAFMKAPTGLYCGPLRLLAMEVFESVNAQGVYCNLLTGQECCEIPGANHTSCTVEMAALNKRVDVAVLDEVQLLGDESRGWAWTRVLLGLPANEIHLCGDGSALSLVESICQSMGEAVEVQTYERFTPLQLDKEGLRGGYKDVEPGDCVVAFSRRDIFDIKRQIEEKTPHKVCVVYGALPPETRRQQAKLFNEPVRSCMEDNGYNVLVASDAVGMGLNLNIRRVIFHSLHKNDGTNRVPVPTSQVLQIAGRAGRRNSAYSSGLVTCSDRADMKLLRKALAMDPKWLVTPQAGLFPEYEQLEAFAGSMMGKPSFEELLRSFCDAARLDGTYFLCQQEQLFTMAKLLDQVDGLSLQERYTLCMAPSNTRDPRIVLALLTAARSFAAGEIVPVGVEVPKRIPSNQHDLRELETLHQIVSQWLWLSLRFGPDQFQNQEYAEALSQAIVEGMAAGLSNMAHRNEVERAIVQERLADMKLRAQKSKQLREEGRQGKHKQRWRLFDDDMPEWEDGRTDGQPIDVTQKRWKARRQSLRQPQQRAWGPAEGDDSHAEELHQEHLLSLDEQLRSEQLTEGSEPPEPCHSLSISDQSNAARQFGQEMDVQTFLPSSGNQPSGLPAGQHLRAPNLGVGAPHLAKHNVLQDLRNELQQRLGWQVDLQQNMSRTPQQAAPLP